MTHKINIPAFVSGMLFALVVAGSATRPALAQEGDESSLEILSAGAVLKNQVYYLNARFRLRLKPQMVEALHAGIPLTFSVSVEVDRPRSYIWDAEVALLEQRYRLTYQALTENYVLKNLNSGVENDFPNLIAASDVLGTIVELPILDRNLLNPDDEYRGRMRVRLDREYLPLPLRLQSYFYSDWTLASDWYSWPIHF